MTILTTKLSNKSQVTIPESLLSKLRWDAGTELVVIDSDEGIILKRKPAFEPTTVSQVFGFLKGEVTPKTDAQIEAALTADIRTKWRARG